MDEHNKSSEPAAGKNSTHKIFLESRDELPKLTDEQKATNRKIMRRSRYSALTFFLLFFVFFYSLQLNSNEPFYCSIFYTFIVDALLTVFFFLITIFSCAIYTKQLYFIKNQPNNGSFNTTDFSSPHFESHSSHSIGWYNDLSNPANPMSPLSSMYHRNY